MFIYFWERERERERARAGEGQSERETQNPKQAPGSELSAQPDTRLKPMNYGVMTWAKVGCLTDWATQVPLSIRTSNTSFTLLGDVYFLFHRETTNSLLSHYHFHLSVLSILAHLLCLPFGHNSWSVYTLFTNPIVPSPVNYSRTSFQNLSLLSIAS